MTKQIVATAIAAVALTAALASFAQMARPMMHKPMLTMHKTMAASKGVYVCKICKEYFSPTTAKKMGYKDDMGHKLTKLAKVPAGYMDGSKMKM